MQQIYNLIERCREEFISIRRELHKIPELSGMEYKTQRFILQYLAECGIEHRPVSHTGVYAIVRGGRAGKTIALRGDMDALPMQEQTGVEYRSRHENVMHACGHDAHMTFLLGTAYVLHHFRDELCGNVVFLFQPSEERFGGAKRMIDDGVLENPAVDAVVAAHVWGLPVGTIVSKPGAMMACPDIFKIVINGSGGHGAEPHLCTSPILPLSKMVSVINDIKAANIDTRNPSVISVCSVHAGEGYNVVPDTGFLEGTIRTYSPSVRREIIDRLQKSVEYIAKAYGATGEFHLTPAYPATINDDCLAKWAYSVLSNAFAHLDIRDNALPAMQGEDFSFFGQVVPSLFLWIGVQNSEIQCVYDLHHPRFNIDEVALEIGIKAFCTLAYNFNR